MAIFKLLRMKPMTIREHSSIHTTVRLFATNLNNKGANTHDDSVEHSQSTYSIRDPTPVMSNTNSIISNDDSKSSKMNIDINHANKVTTTSNTIRQFDLFAFPSDVVSLPAAIKYIRKWGRKSTELGNAIVMTPKDKGIRFVFTPSPESFLDIYAQVCPTSFLSTPTISVSNTVLNAISSEVYTANEGVVEKGTEKEAVGEEIIISAALCIQADSTAQVQSLVKFASQNLVEQFSNDIATLMFTKDVGDEIGDEKDSNEDSMYDVVDTLAEEDLPSKISKSTKIDKSLSSSPSYSTASTATTTTPTAPTSATTTGTDTDTNNSSTLLEVPEINESSTHSGLFPTPKSTTNPVTSMNREENDITQTVVEVPKTEEVCSNCIVSSTFL